MRVVGGPQYFRVVSYLPPVRQGPPWRRRPRLGLAGTLQSDLESHASQKQRRGNFHARRRGQRWLARNQRTQGVGREVVERRGCNRVIYKYIVVVSSPLRRAWWRNCVIWQRPLRSARGPGILPERIVYLHSAAGVQVEGVGDDSETLDAALEAFIQSLAADLEI